MTLAYIPYFEQPSLSIGPLTVHAFGVIVAASVLIGLELGKRRFQRVGLDTAVGERMGWWLIIGGFLGAHLFAVLFYFPRELARDPLKLLRIWDDISSFGGILGGALALWLFFRYRTPELDARARWAYVDVAGYVFPISLMIGRLGCTLAHDHPGTVTSFPLAVSLRSADAQSYIERVYANAARAAELPGPETLMHMGFHDLGWYEFLYLAAVVVPVILVRARRSAVAEPGHALTMFLVLYMPVRFALDFLRVSDARYSGFTPAQWAVLAVIAVLPGIYMRAKAVNRGDTRRP
jgi:phosphatidylglycerol:prolipoprotein diacylglycerol transferase